MDSDLRTLRRWRLTSQGFAAQRWDRPDQAVEWLGGVQAQDYGWGKWSIGLRTEGSSDADVERAIQDRHIVRTWMFRGTLHFVSPKDLSWLTSLLAPGIIQRNERRYRQLGLDGAAFAKSQEVTRQALEVNGLLTRSQLRAYLEEGGVPAVGQQFPYLIQRAALDGLICCGPQQGAEPTYVLVSDWVGAGRTLDRADALASLAARYFAGHGPATRQDFAWWAGLTARDAKSAIDSASGIVQVDVHGVPYWASDEPTIGNMARHGHLLPPFDEYLLGYRDRVAVLDPEYARAVNAGGGMPKATVMVDGDILGTWRYRMGRREMVVSIEPFRHPESDERDALDRAAAAFGRFKSMSVSTHFVQMRPREDGAADE